MPKFSGYKNLITEIAKKNIERNIIAQVLGIHRNSLNNKLSGTTQFTVDEALTIKKIFFPEYDFEYLFSNEQEGETIASWGSKDSKNYLN